MKNTSLILLSILSGVLLWLSWPVLNTTVLIFIAFVPLLYAADFVNTKTQFFYLSFITAIIWNIGATWWVINSTEFAVAAFIFNTLLMCIPLMGYYIFKRKYGILIGDISLIAFWMTFEYVHLNWQLSWTWLNLGNVFASHPEYVFWYSYTGVAGGTLWVLLSNLLIKYLFTELVEGRKEQKAFSNYLIISIVAIALPVSVSYILSNRPIDRSAKTKEVLIIQPNIDPYQKFDGNSFNQQIDILLQLSEKGLDSNTSLILWPETALAQPIVQRDLSNSFYYKKVFDFINRHPNISLQTGFDSYVTYSYPATKTARHLDNGQYFDGYNSAVIIKAGQANTFYNKSKLVPGVETLPSYLKFLSAAFEKFGGTTSGYGIDSCAKIFDAGSGLKTAPIICYESVYGEYVSSYVNKGANLLTIMTNDGWWGNTPGYKQHLQYARLRAIENNCYVIRSANTGISAVIDNRGNVLETKPWDKADFIKAQIPVRQFEKTFYCLHGDFLYFLAMIITYVLILFHLVTAIIPDLKTKFINPSNSNQ